MLRALAEGLWVIDHPLVIGPVELGARTTVLRLADGGLLLVSPGKMDEAVRAQVSALGPVRALAAPNRFHHLYLGQAARAWPEAKVFAPPGLREKLAKKGRDLRVEVVLEDAGPPEWDGTVEVHRIRGMPTMEELAFFHRPSRTLVLTDLVFNLRQSRSWLSRTLLRLYGAWERFGPTRLERFLVKDRAAARASIDRLLAWDFDRVVMAHGDVLETGGQAAVRDAFAHLRG